MAWTQVEPRTRAYVDPTAVRVAKRAKKIVILIGDDVLGKAGWKAGEYLSVFRGTGDEVGKLRLKRAGGGYKIRQLSPRTRTLGIEFAAWDEIRPDSSSSQTVRFKHDADGDGALELALPTWGQGMALRAK